MMSLEGIVFCVYKTPCGYCSKFNKECTEKRCEKNKNKLTHTSDQIPVPNPAGEYADEFAKDIGMKLKKTRW